MADETDSGGEDEANRSAEEAQPEGEISGIGVNPLTLPNRPKWWAIILIALIAIAFTALWQLPERLDMFLARHCNASSPPGVTLEQCAM